MPDPPYLIALAALLTAAGAFYKAWVEKKLTQSTATKVQADSESILVETAMALILPLKERITTLEAQNAALSVRVATLEKELADE